MKTWLEISVSGDERQRELLLPTMIELGFAGFQETETELLCYRERTERDEAGFEMLKSEIRRALRVVSSNADIRVREIPARDWNEQWEKTIAPVEIGSRFVVKPSWRTYDNRENRIVIQIDPKMSFGTGYHESTRLALRLLERFIRPGSAMLDVGTGTGILAIAAVKLGARSALGIDIDEWSIRNALENAAANGAAGAVEISPVPFEELGDRQFDLIAANLTLNTNCEMLPRFSRLLAASGTLILSGMLTTDRSAMQSKLDEHRMRVLGELTEGGWIGMAAGGTSP